MKRIIIFLIASLVQTSRSQCNSSRTCCRFTSETVGHLIDYKQLFKNTQVRGAQVNGPCSIDLHNNFTSKIYTAIDRSQFITAVSQFLQHISSNPSLESESCFSYFEEKAPGKFSTIVRYNDCNATLQTCQCHSSGSFKSYLNPKTMECHLLYPTFGDACTSTRSYEINKAFFTLLRSTLDLTTNEREVNAALKPVYEGYMKYRRYISLESDVRDACFSPDFSHNMECKLGKCSCVHFGAHFQYVANQEDLCKCNGLKSTYCELSRNKCTSKICPNLDIPQFTFVKADCAFGSCTDSEDHFNDDFTIKTCGGIFNQVLSPCLSNTVLFLTLTTSLLG